MPPIQGTPKEYDSEKASTFPLDQEHKKPLLRPWFYNLGFILFFSHAVLSSKLKLEVFPTRMKPFPSEIAPNMPGNGEFDYNKGECDYFFGKPYHVTTNPRDLYYE